MHDLYLHKCNRSCNGGLLSVSSGYAGSGPDASLLEDQYVDLRIKRADNRMCAIGCGVSGPRLDGSSVSNLWMESSVASPGLKSAALVRESGCWRPFLFAETPFGRLLPRSSEKRRGRQTPSATGMGRRTAEPCMAAASRNSILWANPKLDSRPAMMQRRAPKWNGMTHIVPVCDGLLLREHQRLGARNMARASAVWGGPTYALADGARKVMSDTSHVNAWRLLRHRLDLRVSRTGFGLT